MGRSRAKTPRKDKTANVVVENVAAEKHAGSACGNGGGDIERLFVRAESSAQNRVPR
jgi:hypothetical protein